MDSTLIGTEVCCFVVRSCLLSKLSLMSCEKFVMKNMKSYYKSLRNVKRFSFFLFCFDLLLPCMKIE